MSFSDFAASITLGSAAIIGDTVTIYPVHAAEVPAYLADGEEGVEIIGMFERQPELNEEGNRVDNLAEVFTVDEGTAAPFILRESSIAYDGRLYDIVRVLPDHPGAFACHLEEFR